MSSASTATEEGEEEEGVVSSSPPSVLFFLVSTAPPSSSLNAGEASDSNGHRSASLHLDFVEKRVSPSEVARANFAATAAYETNAAVASAISGENGAAAAGLPIGAAETLGSTPQTTTDSELLHEEVAVRPEELRVRAKPLLPFGRTSSFSFSRCVVGTSCCDDALELKSAMSRSMSLSSESNSESNASRPSKRERLAATTTAERRG